MGDGGVKENEIREGYSKKLRSEEGSGGTRSCF